VAPEVEAAVELLQAIEARGAMARALGGIAVAIRCPSIVDGSPLARTYGDLDLVTDRRSATEVARIVSSSGYQPSRRFNAAHGRTRLLFTDSEGRHLDLFIGTFSMCHVLHLEHRLAVDRKTIPLADLFLTKLQIAQLNAKDVIDVIALLVDHPLSTDDRGINVGYVSDLLSREWGWWRTVDENLPRVLEHAARLGLDRLDQESAQQRGTALLKAVSEAPKTLAWKLRARVGDRMRWREEPEEIGA